MTILKRMAFGLLAVGLMMTVAAAGPNAGGVMVLHATSIAYTADVTDYTGQSNVWCGNDGPEPPQVQVCPPYDPWEGANPCIVTAANPTSTVGLDLPQVFFVMAAFDGDSCPRLKSTSFGLKYDEAKLGIAGQGPCQPDNLSLEIPLASSEDGQEFPFSMSGVGLAFSTVRTSRLQELYWFGAYAYSGDSNLLELVRPPNVTSDDDWIWVDDSVPPVEDKVHAAGKLGFGGTVGENPPPGPSPVEEISWGQIKATYSTK